MIRSTWGSTKLEKSFLSSCCHCSIYNKIFAHISLILSLHTLVYSFNLFLPFSTVVQLHPWMLTSGNSYLYQLLIPPSSWSYASISEVRILTVRHKTEICFSSWSCCCVQFRLSHSEIAWFLHVNYGSLYLPVFLGNWSTHTV